MKIVFDITGPEIMIVISQYGISVVMYINLLIRLPWLLYLD